VQQCLLVSKGGHRGMDATPQEELSVVQLFTLNGAKPNGSGP
jgi:hypothetical protein